MNQVVVIEGEEAELAIEVIPETFFQIRMLVEFLSANPFASAKAVWTATSINNPGDVCPRANEYLTTIGLSIGCGVGIDGATMKKDLWSMYRVPEIISPSI